MAKLTWEILDTGPATWSSNLSGAHTVYLHAFKTTLRRSTIGRISPNGDEQLSVSPGGDSRCCGSDTSVTPPCSWPCASLHWSRICSWSKLTLTSWDSSRCVEIFLMSRWWPLGNIFPLLKSWHNKRLQQYDSRSWFSASIYLVLMWIRYCCNVLDVCSVSSLDKR